MNKFAKQKIVKQCEGCKEEMEMCYFYQNKNGIVAGLDWYENGDEDGLHCLVFAFNEITGERIAW